jgi:hypothetical protein
MFDYFASRRTGEAAPPSFSGGEFFLLILLLFTGGALATWQQWGVRIDDEGWDLFGRQFAFSGETSVGDVKPDCRILVVVDRGDILVIPDDTKDMRVLFKKIVTTPGDEEDARRRAEEIKIETISVSDGYEIRQTSRSGSSSRIRVDLEIHLPKNVSVVARSSRGDITISGLTGSVTAETRRGNTDLRDIGRDVQVEMLSGRTIVNGVGGNVRLSGRGSEIAIAEVKGEAIVEGEFGGPIRFSKIGKGARFLSQRTDLTLSGEVPGYCDIGGGTIELVDSRGGLNLVTRNKDIRLENVLGKISLQNRRGNIELRLPAAPQADIQVDNESGAVDLILPANAAFKITASSRGGEVESEFQAENLKHSKERNVDRLEGSVGAKGPQIQLNTTYGTVSLRKTG